MGQEGRALGWEINGSYLLDAGTCQSSNPYDPESWAGQWAEWSRALCVGGEAKSAASGGSHSTLQGPCLPGVPSHVESLSALRPPASWELCVQGFFFLLWFSEVGPFVGRSGVLLSAGDPAKSLCV